MNRSADIVIAGGGCSGLSLALHLLHEGIHNQSIVIIEPRLTYERDRTWCFWDTEEHVLPNAISHQWDKWKVAYNDQVSIRSSSTFKYCHIASDDFYKEAMQQLQEAKNVTFLLGETVKSFAENDDHVLVRTSMETWKAKWFFDSRPPRLAQLPRSYSPPPLEEDVHLLQHFYGYHIQFEEAILNPETIDLMDFNVSQEAGPRFVYVLPYNATEALVENTYMTEELIPMEVHKEELESYIEQRWPGVSYTIHYTEKGVLPMHTAPFSISMGERVLSIGLRGGASKPSTGYAFLAIQRQTKAIAKRLAQQESPHIGSIRTTWQTFLDRVFLCYIHRNPKQLPAIMSRLFAKVRPEVLVRFLSERCSFWDTVQVILCMPKIPFLREMVLSRRVWLRSTPKQLPSTSKTNIQELG